MDIPAWGWVLIIGLGIVFAFLFITIVVPLLWAGVELIRALFADRRYSREAKKHNAKARELRLQKTEYFGYPLPMGKEGTLRITRHDMIHNANRVSSHALEKAYADRARDLWIEIERSEELDTGDIVIRWRPRKDKKPREVY